MRAAKFKKPAAGLWRPACIATALLWLVFAGCSSQRALPLDHFPAGGTGKARVSTQDGYTYNFEHVHVRGDSLIGSYTVVEERDQGNGEIAYVDVERYTTLPLDHVSKVEVKHFDYGNTILLGAGAVLLTIWARSVIDSGDENNDESGKPPITP